MSSQYLSFSLRRVTRVWLTAKTLPSSPIKPHCYKIYQATSSHKFPQIMTAQIVQCVSDNPQIHTLSGSQRLSKLHVSMFHVSVNAYFRWR